MQTITGGLLNGYVIIIKMNIIIIIVSIIFVIIIIMSGTFRRSRTDPTLLRTEPVEANAVDRIWKSEILDPEIQKSKI